MAMVDEVHVKAVDAWLVRATVSSSTRGMLRTFEAALSGIWLRAVRTLGRVTLDAVAHRVLANAVDRFPFLGALQPLPSGQIHCNDLHLETRLVAVPYGDLVRSMRSVLIELLSLLSSLTADILTPELHAELARMPARELEARPRTSAIGVATS